MNAAYFLFVDPSPSTSTAAPNSTSTFERLLDWLARTFQPAPGMLHVALLFVMASGQCHHFSTYVGDEGNWRSSADAYYETQRWHAVPIAMGSDVNCLIDACNRTKGSPYSISRYVASTALMGWLSYLLPDHPRSPAHCGGLMARIVNASGSDMLDMPSPRYAPSDIYTVTRKRRARCPEPAASPTQATTVNEPVFHRNVQTILQSESDAALLNMHPASRAREMVSYTDALIHARPQGLSFSDTLTLGWIASRMISLYNKQPFVGRHDDIGRT